MELPSKVLEQIAYNTRPKIEKHMLIVVDKSIHEEHLNQSLQTNNKQYKIAVIFLTGYNGIFNVTDKNNKFYFIKSFSESSDVSVISISKGAYEIESLNDEIKRIIIEEGYFREATYSFTIKPNFSTLGSIIENSSANTNDRSLIDFRPNDSIRDLLGFKPKLLHEEYNLSDYPGEILSFDNVFLECNIAQVMIFKGKRSGIIHNFAKDVDPGYKYIEEFRGGVQWYMTESKDIISSVCFKLKNENNELVSFNGQSITFRLSIKEI